ncbi:MAG: hypothetical protein JJE21_02885 [Spirochaetaceae bacterium]|nr:hypothetical protein [Spirochaetaceae bacterium]
MEKLEIRDKDLKNNETLILKPCWVDSPEVMVKVVLEHDESNLIATFEVFEKQLRRMSTHNNDEVYEDSCVEIFLKREDEEFYRNFELSATTFMLVGRGSSRYGRIRYDISYIEKIHRSIEILENNSNRSHYIIKESINLRDWHILKAGESIKELKIVGNIYKCGPTFEKLHFQSLFEMDPNLINFHNAKCFRKFEFI